MEERTEGRGKGDVRRQTPTSVGSCATRTKMQADLEKLGPKEKKSYMMQLGEVFDVDAEMVEDVELLILHHAADCPRLDAKPGSKPGNGSAPAWAVKLAKSFVAVATVAGVMI